MNDAEIPFAGLHSGVRSKRFDCFQCLGMGRVVQIRRNLGGRHRFVIQHFNQLFRRHVRVEQADMAGLAAVYPLLLRAVREKGRELKHGDLLDFDRRVQRGVLCFGRVGKRRRRVFVLVLPVAELVGISVLVVPNGLDAGDGDKNQENDAPEREFADH